jgi:hypothetical protein
MAFRMSYLLWKCTAEWRRLRLAQGLWGGPSASADQDFF